MVREYARKKKFYVVTEFVKSGGRLDEFPEEVWYLTDEEAQHHEG